MAWPTVDLGAITNALPTLLADKIIPQMNRSAPELQLIPFWQVLLRTWFGMLSLRTHRNRLTRHLLKALTVSTYGDDDIVPATLNWCDYSESIAVTGKALSASLVVRLVRWWRQRASGSVGS
jgi:hypothetical protein